LTAFHPQAKKQSFAAMSTKSQAQKRQKAVLAEILGNQAEPKVAFEEKLDLARRFRASSW